jgi:hypothetical protein
MYKYAGTQLNTIILWQQIIANPIPAHGIQKWLLVISS